MGRRVKCKPVTVEIIERERDGVVSEPYRVMNDMLARYRPELVDCKIGLAWRRGWKRSVDGLLKAGQCKKRGDLDRALNEYDFIILLNCEVWSAMNDAERNRLMYHELCHAQICKDANGDAKRDEAGRPVCRIRKHDIEEFAEVAEAFGMDHTINDLAIAALEDATRPLLAMGDHKEPNHPTETEKPAESTPPEEPIPQTETPIETIEPKLKGLKNCSLQIRLRHTGGAPGWWCGWYSVKLGNREGGLSRGEAILRGSRSGCLQQIRSLIVEWALNLTMQGKDEIARRQKFLDQVADIECGDLPDTPE